MITPARAVGTDRAAKRGQLVPARRSRLVRSDAAAVNDRFVAVAAVAAKQYGAVSTKQLEHLGVHRRMRSAWVRSGRLLRLGPRSYAVAGSPRSWLRAVWAAAADFEGVGYVAGRACARLHGLDGFDSNDVEVLTTREHRRMSAPYVVRSTRRPLGRGDTVTVAGIRCLNPERLILEAPLFHFTQSETENAIDSAIRERLVSEGRLRDRVVAWHDSRIKGSRQLLEAMTDTGGESRLERAFLAIVRRAALPRPELRKVWRDGARTLARIDATFPGGLLVELEGHRTHSTRRQRASDEERRTAMTLRGQRFIVFTYIQVRDKPGWVAEQVAAGLAMPA